MNLHAYTYPVSSKSRWGGSGALLVPPLIGQGWEKEKEKLWEESSQMGKDHDVFTE